MLHRKLGTCIKCNKEVTLNTYIINNKKFICPECMDESILNRFVYNYEQVSQFDSKC